MHKTLLIMIACSLAACSSTPRRDTYDTIKSEIDKAAKVSAANNSAVEAALLPPLKVEVPQAQKPLEERFNVSFNNIPAQQFFVAIASGTRYNMLVHPDVTGNISANLKDVTLFEALDAIRDLYGYDYRTEGNRIVIKPLTMQTSVFKINYLNNMRRGSSDTRVIANTVNSNNNGSNGSNGQSNSTGTGTNGSNGSQPGTPGSSQTTLLTSSKVITTNDGDFWKDLKEAIEALVGGVQAGRSVVVSPQSGVIVVRAMPEELRNVSAYLKATQLSVERQVILEAKILEVQLNDSSQTGVNWSVFANKDNHAVSLGLISPNGQVSPLSANGAGVSMQSAGNTALLATPGSVLSAPTTALGSMFGLAFQTRNFGALISFLETQGTVSVLSSPRISTLNNEKAILKVGSDEFFVVGINTTTTSNNGGTTTTPNVVLQPFFSGVVLDVTPQIDDAGNVILHVHPSVTDVKTVTKNIDLGLAGTLQLPLALASSSETDSVVRGQDGQIVAIGGLMRQSTTNDKSQVPGIGDVPVVGALFGNKGHAVQKRELVILIKPTVVHDDNAWNKDVLESQRRVLSLDPRGAQPTQ